MKPSRHIQHYRHHIGLSYSVSLSQRIYSALIVPLIIIVSVFVLAKISVLFSINVPPVISAEYFMRALGATLLRLIVAYVFALLLAIPLSILISENSTVERIFLPLFDIIQSVPVLAFFPIIILFFVRLNFLDGAAIFILFLGMLWNIVFSIIGGLKVIPTDIKSAAHVFHIRGFPYVWKVILPAVAPYLITGSILAWAQGWNIIIVAEVLHTYIPKGSASQDLFGIGSILVNAVASGQNNIFLGAIFVMVLAIALFNFFIWQKLLHYAERFKFE